MNNVVMYFDGGIREEIMAYGYVAFDPETKAELFTGSRTCGSGSSNIAEYRALIAGLQGCLKRDVKEIHIIGDSQLIIKQVTGVFRVNKPTLKEHRDFVLKLLSKFEIWSIKWVPRRKNKRADELVNQVFERKLKKCRRRKKY